MRQEHATVHATLMLRQNQCISANGKSRCRLDLDSIVKVLPFQILIGSLMSLNISGPERGTINQ